jgi:hypothetical protein
MSKETGGSAFPGFEIESVSLEAGGKTGQINRGYPGMTLRDYFANGTLVGLLQSESFLSVEFDYEQRADFCYRQADAMLKQREKE